MSKNQTKEYFKKYYKDNKKYSCVLCNTKKMNKVCYKAHLKTNKHKTNFQSILYIILK